MTSIQERLQLKRIALDKWTIREQLCLASAVSCSGDQNWMSVSRSLKVLCGANRPADWFSQKSCAVQYGELLENVETPKRKKRTISERDSQPTTETPTESILRKLTQERIAELKSTIQQEQDEYAKLKEEILAVQNGALDDSQIREMWQDIEKEMEQKQVEKQKYEQWLKEREERKNELQRASRTGLFQSKPMQLNLNVKSEDVETDDSRQGTSPLLTSLLKSPATTPTSSNSPTNVRASAPTITNLLTGNTIVTASTQAGGSTQSLQHLQNQPLTGPTPAETAPQVTPKPSQAAPTLSMLLENKNANKPSTSSDQTTLPIEIKTEEPEPMETEDDSSSPNKDEEQQLMEVFKGLIPDNIDELEEILTNNNAIIPELLEEESILENIESPIGDEEDLNDKNKVLEEQNEHETESELSKNLTESSRCTEVKVEIKEADEVEETKDESKIETNSGGGQPTNDPDKSTQDAEAAEDSSGTDVKRATTDDADNQDSGDSSDVQVIEPMETDSAKNKEPEKTESRQSSPVKQRITPFEEVLPQKNEDETEAAEEVPLLRIDNEETTAPKESHDEQAKSTTNDAEELPSAESTNPHETPTETVSDNTTTITIIDTDDDSTIEVIKEDKIGKTKRDYSRKNQADANEKKLEDIDENRLSISLRKLRERDGSESPLVDDETSDSLPRTRRRYSSTPVIDSIPNSPASSDDREYRTWKKCVLTVYNNISTHKSAAIFSKQSQDEIGSNYKQIILRPIDLQMIKQNIESGVTRTTGEFQRDVMLMCQNAVMYYGKDESNHSIAKEFITDVAMAVETLVENARKDADAARSSQASGSSSKNRSRKSTRLP